MKIKLSPAGVLNLIGAVAQLGIDLARFLPGGLSADEASKLVADALTLARDVAALVGPALQVTP